MSYWEKYGERNPLRARLTKAIVSVPELGLTQCEVDLTAGVHVMYGTNGVGKSRFLTSLYGAEFRVQSPLVAEDPRIVPLLWSRPPSATNSTGIYSEYLGDRESTHEWAVNTYDEHYRMIADSFENLGLINKRFGDYPSEPEIRGGPPPLVKARYEWTWAILAWAAGPHLVTRSGATAIADACEEVFAQGDLSLQRQGQFGATELGPWWMGVFARVTHEHPALTACATHYRQSLLLLASDRLDRGSSEDPFGEREEVGLGYFLEDLAYDVLTADEIDRYYPDTWRNRGEVAVEMQRYRVLERTVPWDPILIISEDSSEVVQLTLQAVLAGVGNSEAFKAAEAVPSRDAKGVHRFVFGPVEAPEVHPAAKDVCAEISTRATRIFQNLILDAGALRVSMTSPGEWDVRDRLTWEAHDRSGRWISLTELSDTQQRWARFAIRLAIQQQPERLKLLLIDEPERGLHRRAESHLQRALARLAEDDPDLTIVLASHSPIFLEANNATLHHLARNDDGQLEVHDLKAVDRHHVNDLGISTTDLLQLTRIVLLVEGQHDEWVLDELFHDEFARLGVRVMSMRGANKLIAAADGQLLFDFTDAHLVVMLDNSDTDSSNSAFNEAIDSWNRTGNISDAEQALAKLLKPNKEIGRNSKDAQTEATALKDFCLAAISLGRHNRVGFQHLGKLDIEDYFDPRHFLPKTSGQVRVPSWTALRKEHQAAKRRDSGTPNFKRWLTATYDARFSERNFREAVRDARAKNSIHPDFTEALDRLRDLSRLIGA